MEKWVSSCLTKQNKHALKLQAMVVGIAMLTGASLGAAAYFSGDAIVTAQAEQRLKAGAENANAALQAYLGEEAQDLTLFAGRKDVSGALTSFAGAYKSLAAQGDPADLLQQAYIADNPHPPGERKLLESSNSLLVYDLNHRPQHTEFRALLETRGYNDVFLFDIEANNVYSVQKDSDFGTGFAEGAGPWAG